MRALITGSSGFVAQHLAQYLKSQGDQVLGTTLSKDESALSCDEIVTWDITSSVSPEAFERINAFAPEVIYHLAAISHPSQCGDERPTPLAWQVNVEGTSAVIDLAAKLDETPRIVFSSSAKVYAAVDQSPEKSHLVSETAETKPASAYGQTKLAAENLLLEASKSGLEVVVVRAFNHTGTDQEPIYLVPQWCQSLQKDASQLTVYTLNTHLDLSDVRDVVVGYRLLAEKGNTGEIYNLGSGIEVSTQAVLDQLKQISGLDPQVTQLYGNQKYEPIADISIITDQLGFKTTYSLDETLSWVWENCSSE